MDNTLFDDISRLLAGATSRRSGLRAAAAALAALSAGRSLAGEAESDRKRRSTGGAKREAGRVRGDGKPAQEGPCRNRKRNGNTCLKNSECCTRLCRARPGLKNEDRLGRCRCQSRGKLCKATINCCNSLVCIGRACVPPPEPPAPVPVPTGDPCTGNVDTCADPLASCTTYRTGKPVGTYCLLPRGEACDEPTDCVPGDCVGGVCGSCSCPACDEACTPIVCASCTFTTIQAAIDAAKSRDIIGIGSGVYNESLVIDKDLTLRACLGETVTITNANYDERAIKIENGSRLDLIDIVIAGYSDTASNPKKLGGGITSNGNVRLCRNTVIRGSHWEKGGAVWLREDAKSLLVADQTVIENNSCDTYGGGIYVQGNSSMTINGAAVLRTNRAGKYGGGFATGRATDVFLYDEVLIDANQADSYGGNAAFLGWLTPAAQPYRFVLQDDVTISNGKGVKGGGGIYAYGAISKGSEIRIEMRDRARIIDNETDLTSRQADGGGIYMWEGTLSMYDDSEISGNKAGGAGGAMYIAPATSSPWYITTDLQFLMAGNAKITGNSANNAPSLNQTIASNSGGAVYLYSMKGEMRDNATISGNTAEWGGGVELTSGFGTTPSLVLNDSATITGNTATGQPGSGGPGGGVYDKGPAAGSLTINDSASITGNTPDNCDGTGLTC